MFELAYSKHNNLTSDQTNTETLPVLIESHNGSYLTTSPLTPTEISIKSEMILVRERVYVKTNN